jgi:hypothetical protein
VRDDRLKFSVVLPDGFESAPAEFRTPEFPYCYVRDSVQPGRTLFIRMRGCRVLVAPEEMTREDLDILRNAFPGAEFSTERWKAFDLDVTRYVSTDEGGGRWVQYGVGIPLRPEAVLLVVSGPEDRGTKVKELFKHTLGAFEGTPSWPGPNQHRRAPSGFVLKNKHLVLAGSVLLVVSYLAWRRWRRKQVGLHVSPATE